MVDPSAVRDHHVKLEYCYTRPHYREGRLERSIKVYTVNDESRYLLVQNVAALGVTKDLLDQLSLYGNIEEYHILDDYPCEEHTDVYWIKYVDINDARMAKIKMDDQPFFSRQLHICYAPEFETVEETREKLQERRKVIAKKTRGHRYGATKDDERVMGNNSTSLATLLPTDNNTTQPLTTAHHVIPPSKLSQHTSHTTATTGSAIASSGKVNYKKTNTGKMAATGNVKPLSTQERMSLFLEHSGEGKSAAAMTTPKVVIKRDTKFKAACNKLKWLNKDGGPVEQSVTKAPSIAGDSSKIEDSSEDGGQFYSFHEKVDPSIDEAVNPPVKLPTVLLTGHKSVDVSIKNIRSQMDKVKTNSADSIEGVVNKETHTQVLSTEAKKAKRRRI